MTDHMTTRQKQIPNQIDVLVSMRGDMTIDSQGAPLNGGKGDIHVEYVRADSIEALTAERDKYEGAWMTAEGKLEDAVQGLEKCQAELDEYSRQEYPLDHTVHERYRQRDYDANPARITLAALKGESHD